MIFELVKTCAQVKKRDLELVGCVNPLHSSFWQLNEYAQTRADVLATKKELLAVQQEAMGAHQEISGAQQ